MDEASKRAAELLGRMTIEEKARQLVGVEPFGLLSVSDLGEDQLEVHLAGGVGHVAMFAMFSTRRFVSMFGASIRSNATLWSEPVSVSPECFTSRR